MTMHQKQYKLWENWQICFLFSLQLKVREKLRDATEGESIEQLETAMVRFERSHLEDKGDYSRAKERLQYLTLRRG